MRKVLATSHKLHNGDLLVLFTDGISSRFVLEHFRALEAQPLADSLLAAHAKAHDDASCVVLRV
jgi:serine/threonine protein phosphatase PrpC